MTIHPSEQVHTHAGALLAFHTTGTPIPQGSMKHIGGGRIITANKHLKKWREQVSSTARAHILGEWEPLDEPLSISLDFYLPHPAKPRFPYFPAARPDLDKLCRAIFDALKDAAIIRDDSRFVGLHATKNWATGCEPGVRIIITAKGKP